MHEMAVKKMDERFGVGYAEKIRLWFRDFRGAGDAARA
jgi:hypothetical protein